MDSVRCEKHSSGIHAQNMAANLSVQISFSTTLQSSLIRKKSGDFKSQGSAVTPRAYSRSPLERKFVTRCINLLDVAIRRPVHCGLKRTKLVLIYSQGKLWSWNGASFFSCTYLTEPRKSPLHHYATSSLNLWHKAGDMLSHYYTKFWLYNLNDTEIKTQRSMQHFFSLSFSFFSGFAWILVSVLCAEWYPGLTSAAVAL